MIKFNNRTNLMEAIEFNYLLNDVKDPNLYRDVYPYDEIPKVTSSLCRSGHIIVTEETPQKAIELAEQLILEVNMKTI